MEDIEKEKSTKILVIGDRLLVDGMRMAGVHDYIYTDEEKFEEDLLASMARTDISIIVVTNNMLSKLSWRTKTLVENTARPIVINVADISGKEEEKGESLAWMVKRALGMDIMSSDDSTKNRNSNTD